ncbi:hypothetical protein CAEBREN_00803 [Caenorhabditis brenneri]|uniref:Uncharacterized protein n=1 Tax=Caenorhabditis brenneri TaxID=135651 RepID=G0MAT6_CAEBE|nr:hypothetical protein CAEBREN_00803 [Caenorhabditis brenneri]
MAAADAEIRALSDFDDETWNYHRSACVRLTQEGEDNEAQLGRDIKPEETAYAVNLFEQLFDEFGQSFLNEFRDKFFLQTLPTRPCKPDKNRFTKNEGRREESKKFEESLMKDPKYYMYIKYGFWLHDSAITLSCLRGNVKKIGYVEPPEEINGWIDGIVKQINDMGRKYIFFKIGFRHFILKAYQRIVTQLDPFELPLYVTPEIQAEAAPEEIMEEVEESRDMDFLHMMAWQRTMDLVDGIRDHKNCVFMFSAIKAWLDQFQDTMDVLSPEVMFAPRTISSVEDRIVGKGPAKNAQKEPIFPEGNVSIPMLEDLPNRCDGFSNMPAKGKAREVPFWGVNANFKGSKPPQVVNIKIKKAAVSGPKLDKQ